MACFFFPRQVRSPLHQRNLSNQTGFSSPPVSSPLLLRFPEPVLHFLIGKRCARFRNLGFFPFRPSTFFAVLVHCLYLLSSSLFLFIPLFQPMSFFPSSTFTLPNCKLETGTECPVSAFADALLEICTCEVHTRLSHLRSLFLPSI